MELQFEDNEYYLVDENNDTIATTDKILLKEYDGYIKKLSKQNCDEIFGVLDVGALALEECNNTDPLRLDSQKYKQDPYFRIGYLKGFNKAMELNKDKLFTVEDVRKAMSIGLSIGYGRQFEIENKSVEIDSYIQSLQQPKEIEVEIEQVLVQSSIQGEAIWRYKLDENLCLILKKL